METGKVVEIIGAVIDVQFPREAMPNIFDALLIEEGDLTLEVQQQIGDGIVRTIAMGTTDGLKRGLDVKNTGAPISVPVGEKTLGRIMNVLGQPVDNAGPIQADKKMPIHRAAPTFSEQASEVELLETGVLDYADFKNKINDKTVMVCMGMSSNALGTLNDFIKVGKYLEKKNCLFLLDAVHYAHHFSINVQELGCDFMLCSAYKFYGPHVSFLYSRPGLLESLSTDRLIVQDQAAPFIIETGTLNHAACSGVASAIDFISSIGKGASLREKLESAYQKISSHEFELAKYLYDSLKNLEKITVVGPDFSSKKRTPTVSFVHDSFSAQEVCKKLANKNICAWDGHFYALKAIQKLGLESKGGVTRLGISLYNTKQEIDRVIEVIKTI